MTNDEAIKIANDFITQKKEYKDFYVKESRYLQNTIEQLNMCKLLKTEIPKEVWCVLYTNDYIESGGTDAHYTIVTVDPVTKEASF